MPFYMQQLTAESIGLGTATNKVSTGTKSGRNRTGESFGMTIVGTAKSVLAASWVSISKNSALCSYDAA
jgi:hypothetical protein